MEECFWKKEIFLDNSPRINHDISRIQNYILKYGDRERKMEEKNEG